MMQKLGYLFSLQGNMIALFIIQNLHVLTMLSKCPLVGTDINIAAIIQEADAKSFPTIEITITEELKKSIVGRVELIEELEQMNLIPKDPTKVLQIEGSLNLEI